MKKRAQEKISLLRSTLFENGSYKLVALFISLILWLTILGRREFVMNKEIDVEFAVAPTLMVSQQSEDRIRVKFSGPQPLLKKLKATPQNLQISLADRPVGQYEIEISSSKLDIPPGVKVLSIKPTVIRVEIGPGPN